MLHNSYNLGKQSRLDTDLPGYSKNSLVNSIKTFCTNSTVSVNKSVNDFVKSGLERSQRGIPFIAIKHGSVENIAFYSILSYLQHKKRIKRSIFNAIKQSQIGEQIQISEQKQVFTGLFTSKKKARSPPGQIV